MKILLRILEYALKFTLDVFNRKPIALLIVSFVVILSLNNNLTIDNINKSADLLKLLFGI